MSEEKNQPAESNSPDLSKAVDSSALPEKPQPSSSEEPTFGMKAVGITFNPGGMPSVDRAKMMHANCIDQMNALRNDPSSTSEQRRLASIAITEMQGAQMWAVKALTWKD